MDLDVAHFALTRDIDAENHAAELVSPSKEEYKRRIAEGLAAGEKASSRILAFKSKVNNCTTCAARVNFHSLAYTRMGRRHRSDPLHLPPAIAGTRAAGRL